MTRSKKDPVREDRIHNEAIVDAGPEEQALSWYYYLESKIKFPFLNIISGIGETCKFFLKLLNSISKILSEVFIHFINI